MIQHRATRSNTDYTLTVHPIAYPGLMVPSELSDEPSMAELVELVERKRKELGIVPI